MPNSKINNGVINDPPPTPVMPTSNPTPKPESEYNGSITRGSSPTHVSHLGTKAMGDLEYEKLDS
jgi:hypothetical protein